ncbi:hypothetical protein [Corynebacterium sp. MNWGS58]|uniref:hypothetical protein n=1 Tax=Corynebacterium sp. 102791.4 TaxID=3104612 RepID=UPI003518ECD0
MTIAKTSRRRTLRSAALGITAASALVLASCSSEEAADTAASVTSEAGEAAESATKAAGEAAESATEKAKEAGDKAMQAIDAEMRVTPDPEAGVEADSELQIELSGLNTEQGYYVAICVDEEDGAEGRPPLCTGEHGDEATQAWVKTEGGTVDMKEDGTAVVTLRATPTGEGVDCTTQDCNVQLFGDHQEGFKRVEETEIKFV